MSPKVQRIIGWVLSGLIAAFLIVASGVPKFLEIQDPEQKAKMEKMLEHLGWSASSLKVIGVLEILSAVLFLIPRTGLIGSILLTGYLGGAIATHARVGDVELILPVVLAVLVWVGYGLRNSVVFRLAIGAEPAKV